MAFVFDGRIYFSKKIEKLRKKISVSKLESYPKLCSILVQPDKESIIYTNLKKKTLERLGGELIVHNFYGNTTKMQIANLIDSLNKEKDINGVMIQLPLPSCFSVEDRDFLVDRIDPLKDVDGMREDSSFVNPAAHAVLEVINYASRVVKLSLDKASCKVVVLGSRGFEGRKIVGLLGKKGFNVIGLDRDDGKKSLIGIADVVVSATGSPGILKASDVKERSVIIDLGYPKPDVRTDVFSKASFITPVPGGIGPLTIYFLMENLFGSVLNSG